jgi:hypothetical protein
MNRYNQELRKVTPLAQNQAYQITPAAAQQLMQASQADNVINVPVPQSTIDNVFTPQAIGKDPYSPVQRATGLAVRSLPFAVVYIILAIGIAEKMALSDTWIYLLFGIPMLITVAIMSEKSDKYTPAGVEIERISAAERTEFTKGERQERILTQHLAHKQELARMALEASIKMLGGSNDK